jgi:aldose 1-epimerase
MHHSRRRLPWVLAAAVLLAAGCQQQPQKPAETRPATPATTPTPATTAAPAKIKVGGEDVVTLERKATAQGTKPEFLSVTLLPGRGMNVFEITANIPGKGEIPLLVSPPIEEAARQLNGSGKDEYGNLSFSSGGAFLVPYPNRILGKLSADGKSVITRWRSHTMALPANWQASKPGARKHAMHGLILQDQAVDLETQTTADGQTEKGVIHAGNFGGHWLSETDLSFTIALTGAAIEMTVMARNTGKELEPMSIGWHPYFAIPSGDRSQVRLHIPGSMIAEVNNYEDVFPTGRLEPVKGTIYNYEAAEGVDLDQHSLDDNFSHLERTDGAVRVRLIDPRTNYGIQVDALSPEIRTVQIYAPLDKPFVAIEPQFNYADPFGEEWRGMETGMVTLRPGQAVSWKVRLELVTPQKPSH